MAAPRPDSKDLILHAAPGRQRECVWKQGERRTNGDADGRQTRWIGMSERIAKRQFEQPEDDRDRRGAARLGAHEALPHTPPGGQPPETPAPFPWDWIVGNARDLSRVRQPRQKRAPLTDPPRSRKTSPYEGKGACVQVRTWSRLPVVGPEEWDLLEEGKLCLTTTGLLMEGAEEISFKMMNNR